MPTAHFNIKFSKFYIFILFFIYSFLAVSLVYANISSSIILIVCFVCLFAFSQIKLMPCKAIVWQENEGWNLHAKGFTLDKKVLCKSYYTSWGLTIINFYQDHQQLSLVIWRDAMVKNQYKKFRLYLMNGGLYES